MDRNLLNWNISMIQVHLNRMLPQLRWKFGCLGTIGKIGLGLIAATIIYLISAVLPHDSDLEKLKLRADVLQTQHRIDPLIERRGGYQPSVRVFVPCHGEENTPGHGDVGSGRRCPPSLLASELNSAAKISGRPTNSAPLHPPIVTHPVSFACV